MNYLGIIALCLGAIAVFIATQYMNTSDKIYSEVKNIRAKCINVNKINSKQSEMLDLLNDVKNKSGLEFNDIKKLIFKYKKELENKVNKEGFENFNDLASKNNDLIYSSALSRGLNFNKDQLKNLDYGKVKELASIVLSYEGLFKKTFERLKMLNKKQKGDINDFNSGELYHNKNPPKYKNVSSNSCSAKSAKLPNLKSIPLKLPNPNSKWCKMEFDNKTFCLQVPMKELCLNGKLVNSTKGCDNY
tara:strand:- start:5 stop:742 length:738 start_codon:yes stop_codon:yes gene_type:complete